MLLLLPYILFFFRISSTNKNANKNTRNNVNKYLVINKKPLNKYYIYLHNIVII